MQFLIVLATRQVFHNHVWRVVGRDEHWPAQRRTFHQGRNFCSQCGPRQKTSLLPTHQQDVFVLPLS